MTEPQELEVNLEEDTLEAPELSLEETEKQMIDLSASTFFRGDKLLRGTSKAKGSVISRKGIIRAVRYALNIQVTDKKIILRNNAEQALASALYEMMAARTIMQAHLIKQNAVNAAEENTNGEEKVEEQSVAGNRDTEEVGREESLPSNQS